VRTEVRSEEPGEREGHEWAESTVDECGDEDVGVQVNAFQAAFVLENLEEGVNGSCVRAMSWVEGLDDEAGADEVEWGEEEAGNDVGGNGDMNRRLVEGCGGRQEYGLEEVVDEGLKRCSESVVDAGR